MKRQFQSNEVLRIRLSPFIDKEAGTYIIGTDAVTITVRKPDGSTATYSTVTSPAVEFDGTVHIWKLDIPIGSFLAGEWLLKAVSDNANSLPQWQSYYWGDYVDYLSSIKNKTDNLPASPANEVTVSSVLTETTAAKVAAEAAQTLAGTAATQATVAATDAAAIRKIQLNRWKVQGTQLLVYEADGTTIYRTYNFLDDSGLPSSSRIFERVPA